MPTDASPKPAMDVPRRVVVKFRDPVVLPYEDGAERHVLRLRVGPWAELAQRFRGIRLDRLFRAASAERIGQLVAGASARDHRYRAANLLSYFVIRCPAGVAPDELASALREWRQVETAYVDPLDDSPAPPETNPQYGAQTYLRPPATAAPPSPQGAIDAQFAWLQPGGTGTGQKLVDLERGARLGHRDLVGRGIVNLGGANDPGLRHQSHGTSVLGVVAAVDNDKDIIGIAPDAGEVAYVSQVLDSGGVDRPDAVLTAIEHLTQAGPQDAVGRVLLLEVELGPQNDLGAITDVNGQVWNRMPMETAPADFEMIRLATALGIVVVEATGNGHHDLDLFQAAPDGKFVLSRAHPEDFKDSGAIMVGGSTSSYPYRPSVVVSGTLGTSFGTRVDCFAWADGVRTCGVDTATGADIVTDFGGTSSAAAIVAGAALLVQGVAGQQPRGRLSPREMRALLSNDVLNTRSANYGVDRIGVMPDLRNILQEGLGAAPDVYMRDYVGDTGEVHAGAASLSPDIIVRPVAVTNPGVAFGPGTEGNLMLGPTATSGQDNFVYVRVWNRTAIAATNVRARVFYAPAATLLTPNDWRAIGVVDIANVPANNVMTVSAAIPWPAATVPSPGHYCFIGLVGNAQDPAPDPAAFLNFDYYLAYIRSNNNVTWRNFNVVAVAPPSPSGGADVGDDAYDFEFAAPGVPDSDRHFSLVAGASLPPGSRAALELPKWLLGDHPLVEIDAARPTGRVPITTHGRTTLPRALFPAKSRSRCRLIVQVPRTYRARGWEVYVSQLYEGFEVGRLTWRSVADE